MNNICEKLEMEYSIKEKQPTFKDMLMELNKLRLENEILKADKEELQKENIQLKNDVQILHNKLNENSQYTTLVDSNDDLSYMDEYAKGNKELEEELAKAYRTTSDDYKFGGHDLKEL